MLGKDNSNGHLHPIDIPVGYRFFSSSNRMGLPPHTYTVTASPLWAYNFTTLSSSFPGTKAETWSVPRVGKAVVTSARSFLLQKANQYLAWVLPGRILINRKDSEGLPIKSQGPRKSWFMMPYSHTLFQNILFSFSSNVSSIFTYSWGQVFPFYKERGKLRTSE